MKPLIQITKGASLVLTSLFAASVFAAPVPHTFSNGQPADANQVNENFQELVTRIDAIQTGVQGPQGEQGPVGPQGPAGTGVVQINFDPYRHNYSSKTFRVSGTNDVGEGGWFWQEVRSYDRTTTPGTLIETRVQTDHNAAIRWYRKFYFTSGQGQDKVLNRFEEYDKLDTSILIASSDYSPGLTYIKNDMIVGHTSSTHSMNDSTTFDWGVVDPPFITTGLSGRVETRILIGQESTTANDVPYDNCLKVLVIRQGSETLLWYCEGQGLVKTVGNGRVRELESTTP